MAQVAGHFSRTKHDGCKLLEDTYDSTGPFSYVMDPIRIHNPNGCLTTYGPRSSYNGVGVSTLSGDVIAPAQMNVDIESIMHNLNVPLSRCRRGKVNPVNLTRVKLEHYPVCNDYLDSQHTRMTDPAMFYRDAPINRFYDLNKDPQANIFFPWLTNTSLEMSDNFIPELPVPMTDVSMVPNKRNGEPPDDTWVPCSIALDVNGNCGTNCATRCRRKTRMTPNYKANTLNERKYKGKGLRGLPGVY